MFGTTEQKPLFQPPSDAASSKPLFNFAQATQHQPPESPISPKTTSAPKSLQPQAFSQPAQAPEATKPPVPAFNFTPAQTKPAGQAQAQPQSRPALSTTPSAPSFATLGQFAKSSEPSITRSTTPPTSPRQKPQSAAPDKPELVHNLATLSLCQPGGLIEEYLEYSLPKMLKRVVMEHNAWVHSETIGKSAARIRLRFLTSTQNESRRATSSASMDASGSIGPGSTQRTARRRRDARDSPAY